MLRPADMSLRYIELAVRHRQLMGRCDAGFGLDFDEIQEVAAIEEAFENRGNCAAPEVPRRPSSTSEDRFDRLARAETQPAIHAPDLCIELHSARLQASVELEQIDLHTCICRGVPAVSLGQSLELRISALGDLSSYRFMTRVEWTRRADSDRHVVGLAFIGVPFEIRYAQFGLAADDIATESLAA